MELGRVFTDSVIVGQRHRALDLTRVETLAESMDALGLQQPISVYMDDEEAVHLIAGLHRLEAAKALRWEQIDASFVKLSPTRREMWEIAENLFRVDLSKDQRDEHIRRYAKLIEKAEEEASSAAKVQQSAALSPKPKTGRGNKGTARKVAEETGLSVDTVRRALNHQQTKSVPPPAAPHNPMEAYNKWASDMNRIWSRAPQEWRDRWLADIDAPVFDRSAA